MHAISSQITPPSLLPKETQLDAPVLDGIVEIVTDAFVLRNLQTLNGVKIVLVSDLSSQREQTSTLKKVQEAYADFVSKNPFQEADMPIKSDLFEEQVSAIFAP